MRKYAFYLVILTIISIKIGTFLRLIYLYYKCLINTRLKTDNLLQVFNFVFPDSIFRPNNKILSNTGFCAVYHLSVNKKNGIYAVLMVFQISYKK